MPALCFYRRCKRQLHGEGCPLPNLAFHRDCSIMSMHNPIHNCQSQAGAPSRARTSRVYAVEAFKNMLKMFRGDTNTCVAYTEIHVFVFYLDSQIDLSSAIRIGDGIIDEIH